MLQEEIRIAGIQFDIHWENARTNLDRLERMVRSIDPATDVVLLPEMFTTGFSMNPQSYAEKMNGISLQWMKSISESLQAVVGGSLMIHDRGDYFNRFLWVKPDGKISWYDKRHPFILIDEGVHYHRGSKRGLFEYKGWRFFPSICYDLRFPVWLRNDLAYDVLLNVANWPAVRSYAWNSLLIARAIENQSYVAAVNRCGQDPSGMVFNGDSQLIDFEGKVMSCLSMGEEGVVSAVFSRKAQADHRRKYPYLEDRDSFLLK